MTEPTTWTHRGWIYHTTTYRIAPGYGAKAWCLHCDWGKSWGDYEGAYSGWNGGVAAERDCWDHEDVTREPSPDRVTALLPTG